MTTVLEIAGLAAVDAINPCALAVMVIVLTSLLTANPQKRKIVLFGGLAFTSAVFILYFIYGLGMTSIFSFIAPIAPFVNKAIAIFAIGLGVLNLKDFFMYKPGGLATEMPLSMRPKMKLWVKKITSPKGAFIIGLLVTFFLLPCTIGPYIVASGLLSKLSFMARIPWLLFYNIIFVLPMLAITFGIYFGFTEVERISGWKDKNIKYLHLIEGLILIVLGIIILTGVLH
jgi:cytochrome c biogenesis protein CcdA